MIAGAVEASNQQFAKGRHNVLVIAVDRHDNPWLAPEEDLVAALFGSNVLQINFRRDTGEPVSQELRFSPSGKFLRVWDDARPRFTRVSAVLRLSEAFVHREGVSGFIEPRWVVLHNPHCDYQLPQEIWGDAPQFVLDGEVMRWTDARPASP